MENFRSPNFSLVAEVLIWLVKRYGYHVLVRLDHSLLGLNCFHRQVMRD